MVVKTKSEFLDFLKHHGFKCTPKRERIFQEASAMEGHFETEELAYRLRKKGSRISKATIYRTLPLLVKAGLIKEVINGEKHHHYEHNHIEDQHDHLICLKCRKIIEFEDELLREIQGKICEKHGFKAEKIEIEIFGYCRKCH